MYRVFMLGAVLSVAISTASAQVFVVGGGLARECFDLAKSGNYLFRTAEQTCTRALQEETMTRPNRAATRRPVLSPPMHRSGSRAQRQLGLGGWSHVHGLGCAA